MMMNMSELFLNRFVPVWCQGWGGVDQVILDVRFGLLVDLGISPFSHEQSDPSQAFIFSMFFQ